MHGAGPKWLEHTASEARQMLHLSLRLAGRLEYFEMACLPFGASAAVHGFNRVAQAIESILKTQFGIPCTHYFDDFTFVLPRAFGEAAIQEVRRALSTFGWTVAGGDKDPPLKQKFGALGVEFDLSQATQSTLGAKITVCNTQKRLDEVKQSIRTILANDRLSTPVAAQLRGRLVFANAQAFGKCGALAYHLLGKRADVASNVEALDSDLKWALTWLLKHLERNRSREIPLGPHDPPLLVFTDGACEADPTAEQGIQAGYGAVFYDPKRRVYRPLWRRPRHPPAAKTHLRG